MAGTKGPSRKSMENRAASFTQTGTKKILLGWKKQRMSVAHVDAHKHECASALRLIVLRMCLVASKPTKFNTPPLRLDLLCSELCPEKGPKSVTMHDLVATILQAHGTYTSPGSRLNTQRQARAADIVHLKTKTRLRLPAALTLPGVSM